MAYGPSPTPRWPNHCQRRRRSVRPRVDIETGRLLRSLRGHTADIRALVFTPDGRTLASGSEDRTIRLWNPKQANHETLVHALRSQCVQPVPCPLTGHVSARQPQQRHQDLGSDDRDRPHDPLGQDQYDHHWSVCVAFSPDGIHLASGSDIGKIRIWEVLPSGEEKILHNGHWEETAEDSTETRGFFIEDDGGFQKTDGVLDRRHDVHTRWQDPDYRKP